MKIAICALGQNIRTPTGLFSYFSQLARFLPEVDPVNEYHFVVTEEATASAIVGAGTGSFGDVLWPHLGGSYGRLIMEHFLLGPWLVRNGIHLLYMANAGVRPILLPRSVTLVQAVFGFHQFEAGEIGRIQSLYRKILFPAALSRAELIVLNSEYSLELLNRYGHVAPEKIRTFPHGVNEKLFHDGPLNSEEEQSVTELPLPERFISFVSQMYPYKNVDICVEAFCRFVERTGTDHKLVLVGQFSRTFGEGEPFRQRLIDIAAGHGMADRLMFFERIPVKALRAVYRLADIYVQTSTSETYGRTTAEAMACGCPVVASRAAATPEVLGDAGLYFEGRDAEGLILALLRLHGEPELRRHCIETGLARARKNTTRDEASRLAAVFAEAAKRVSKTA